MDQVVASQRFTFSEVTVLVNNVIDRSRAEVLARRLLDSGSVVTRVEFVSDHLPLALRQCGLSRRDMRRLPHFTDCLLVACTLPGPPWVCYWDADARLSNPSDWISPVLAEMRADPRHMIGNPDNWHSGLSEAEAMTVHGGIAVGYGVSDVALLGRRAELGRRIYKYIAPASWRYPLSAIAPVWEQRVDAYMRRNQRTRVTALGSRIEHRGEVGTNYPRTGPRERLRGGVLRRVRVLSDRVSSHPAMRAWPR